MAIGIILLFVGVTIAPTINFNTVKASTDDDLVEVTTQACGIQGYGNTTVKLTREQYQNLEQYLVEFRARLNQTSTREEAVPLFKDAVVELDKYGLLGGLSVESAQRVVNGQIYGKKYNHLFSKMYPLENQSQLNYLALVSGNVSGAPFMAPVLLILTYMLWNTPFKNDLLWLIFWLISVILIPVNAIYNNVLPIPFAFLKNIFMFNDPWHDCTGYVQTFGLLGKKSYEGTLDGVLPPDSQSGIFGFTGIKIHTGTNIYDYFFLGSALAVGMMLVNRKYKPSEIVE